MVGLVSGLCGNITNSAPNWVGLGLGLSLAILNFYNIFYGTPGIDDILHIIGLGTQVGHCSVIACQILKIKQLFINLIDKCAEITS